MTCAAMASRTPIDVFMNMSIQMFYEFVGAINEILKPKK